MSVRKTIFVLGLVLIALPLPFLGFPQSWKNVFYVASGLGLAIGAFTSYLRAHSPRDSQEK